MLELPLSYHHVRLSTVFPPLRRAPGVARRGHVSTIKIVIETSFIIIGAKSP